MAKNKCRVCGRNCEGIFCMNHKPRNPLKRCRIKPSLKPKTDLNDGKIQQRNEMFISIWNKRPHRSEINNQWLGDKCLTTFFHHILEKENYKSAEFVEENIILLTPEQHDKVEQDPLYFIEINIRRDKLLQKYDRDR